MKTTTTEMRDNRKLNDFIVEDFTGKTSVTLKPIYAYVWEKCDGKRSTDEIAKEMENELGMRVSEGVVALTVNRLFEQALVIN